MTALESLLLDPVKVTSPVKFLQINEALFMGKVGVLIFTSLLGNCSLISEGVWFWRHHRMLAIRPLAAGGDN